MKESIVSIFLIFALFFTILTIDKTRNVSSNNISTYNTPIIIIDAGHGGEDGGAVSQDGSVEKDINLSIALKTNDLLSLLGFQTHMVRETDVMVYNSGCVTQREKKNSDLHNRHNLMAKYDDCIYLSIHQNKFDDSRIWGAQTFYSPNDEQSPIVAKFIQNSIKTLISKKKTLISLTGLHSIHKHLYNAFLYVAHWKYTSNIGLVAQEKFI